MAYVTGIVLMVLCFVGIPLQVFAHNAAVVNYVGTTHGILYIIYLITAYLMSRQLRMKLGSPQTVILLLAGTVPVLTFVVERWITRRYINPALAAALDSRPAGRPPGPPAARPKAAGGKAAARTGGPGPGGG
jgi:integral membrane protein